MPTLKYYCQSVPHAEDSHPAPTGVAQEYSHDVERKIRHRNSLLEGINLIFKGAMECTSEEEVGNVCLAVAAEVTGSAFGLIGEITGTGQLRIIAISEAGRAACCMEETVSDPQGVLPECSMRGLCGQVLLTGTSFFTNGPTPHPTSLEVTGPPPPVISFLGVPLIDEQKVVGLVAVANRPEGYGTDQLEALDALAGPIMQVLLHHRSEQALQREHDELEKRVEERSKELAELTAERSKVLDALRTQERMLVHQSRLATMGEMIGNIAHQWRQPLTVVGLIVQELKITYDVGQFTEEFLNDRVKMAEDQIFHMSRTIDDFRGFFKPEKEKVAFSVQQTVERAVSLVEGSFRTQGISVDVIAEGNPVAVGFPNEYSQVLLNLLLNAKDAFEERNIASPRRIVITAGCDGERSILTIADNAGGIADDTIDLIFDPYFTTKGPDRGTGVGLFMAKKIIENNMNGSLTVRNTEGGAEFRITV